MNTLEKFLLPCLVALGVAGMTAANAADGDSERGVSIYDSDPSCLERGELKPGQVPKCVVLGGAGPTRRNFPSEQPVPPKGGGNTANNGATQNGGTFNSSVDGRPQNGGTFSSSTLGNAQNGGSLTGGNTGVAQNGGTFSGSASGTPQNGGTFTGSANTYGTKQGGSSSTQGTARR